MISESKFTLSSYLNCGENAIKELDISKLRVLRELACRTNEIKELDIRNHLLLEKLDCSENGLKTLRIGNNGRLKSLYCNHNCLTDIDLSSVDSLQNLSVGFNKLADIDISNNKKITTFYGFMNRFDNVDISGLDIDNLTIEDPDEIAGEQIYYSVIDKEKKKVVYSAVNETGDVSIITSQLNVYVKQGENYKIPFVLYDTKDKINGLLRFGGAVNNSIRNKSILSFDYLGMNNDGKGTLSVYGKNIGSEELVLSTIFGDKVRLNVIVNDSGKPENDIPASSVSLNTSNCTLDVGERRILKAEIIPEDIPDDLIIWSTDNPEVVSISCGVIKGLKDGTATVTATTHSGNKTAICKVTVGEDGKETLTPTTAPEVNPTQLPDSASQPTQNPSAGVVNATQVSSTLEVKVPSKSAIKSVKNLKGKKFKVTWNKVKGVKGYEVQYALNDRFTKSRKTKTTTKTKLTIKSLKKNKTYYIRIRSYVKDSEGKKVYSSWSKTKKVKIKK